MARCPVIDFACAGCGARLQAPPAMAQKGMRCPACLRILTVPEPQAAGAAVALFQDESRPPVPLAQARRQVSAPAWETQHRRQRMIMLLVSGGIAGGVGLLVLLLILVGGKDSPQEKKASSQGPALAAGEPRPAERAPTPAPRAGTAKDFP